VIIFYWRNVSLRECNSVLGKWYLVLGISKKDSENVPIPLPHT